MRQENRRNIGIIAHIDAGKTSLTERILFYTQKIHSMGEVHNGTATMDYMPEEQERGITISAACTSCVWQESAKEEKTLLNIIDTPGHVDFTIEVERSLRVLDGAVAVFCAVAGVEAQSEKVWYQSENFGVPKLIFINKIDRVGADFEKALEQIRTRLKVKAIAFTLPYEDKEKKNCILDLLHQTKLYFTEESQGQDIQVLELNEEDKVFIQEKHQELLEAIAEEDEIFFEEFLSQNYTQDNLMKAIRRAVLARKIVPVYAGSALKNKGVQPLLDGIVAFLPSPFERSISFVENSEKAQTLVLSEKEEVCALVFKVLLKEGHKLNFIRVYAGTLKEGDSIYNVDKKSMEKVQRIYKLHADKEEQLECAYAGDIVACIGLKLAQTGDTYTGKKSEKKLENVKKHQPVLTLAFEARNSDEDKILAKALNRYLEEDPSLELTKDEATGHYILSGMGELHLDIIRERLKREYSIDARAGKAQVIYKEFITKCATSSAEIERELGTISHHGALSLTLKPLETEESMEISENKIHFSKELLESQTVPQALVNAAYEAAENALLSSSSGYALLGVDLEITKLIKKENTTQAGIQMAMHEALEQALQKAGLERLEPIMSVEISVIEEFLGNSISALSAVGGKIENLTESSQDMKKIEAKAPLSQLFGFASSLRSATQGRASLVLHFHSFGNIHNL